LRKEAIMARKSALILVAAALTACQHVPYDQPDRGVQSVNVPVVNRSDFALDVAAPGGSLPSSEAARLDDWFRSLQLSCGSKSRRWTLFRRRSQRCYPSRSLFALSEGAPIPAGRSVVHARASELPQRAATPISTTAPCRTSAARLPNSRHVANPRILIHGRGRSRAAAASEASASITQAADRQEGSAGHQHEQGQ
jgi:pilus assembly protein CpaD